MTITLTSAELQNWVIQSNIINQGLQPGIMDVYAASSGSGKSFLSGSFLKHQYDPNQVFYSTFNKKKRSRYPFLVKSLSPLIECDDWIEGNINTEWFLWKRVDKVYYYCFKNAKQAAYFKLTWGC